MRKLFITPLILNKFSCGEVHLPCLCNQKTNSEVFCVLCAVVFYTTSSKDILSLLEIVWKNTACMERSIRQRIATKDEGVA